MLSSTIIINAYLHSLASTLELNSYEPGTAYQSYVIRLPLPRLARRHYPLFTDMMGEGRRIPALAGATNYNYWIGLMRAQLLIDKTWSIVQGTRKRPKDRKAVA